MGGTAWVITTATAGVLFLVFMSLPFYIVPFWKFHGSFLQV